MPRPPVLPVLNWSEVFESGVEWEKWLQQAEDQGQARKMREIYDGLVIDAARAGMLAGLERRVNVVAIAEDWCGDVVRWAPVLAKIASAAGGKIWLRFITREQHPNVFVRFLTNGGEAIPKFVFLNEQFVECGNWGPMPAECRRVLSRGKGANDVGAARVRVKGMYEADPNGEAAVREMCELVETAVCKMP